MPEVRVQDEQGTVHVFPGGSTPAMIARAMNVKPPGEQSPSFGSRVTASYNPDVEAFAEKHPVLGVPARFLDSAGGAAMNFLPSIYHAFTDPLTPDEEANFKGHTRIPGEVILERLSGAEAGVQAGKDYASGKVSLRGAVSVLPEALGTGTGTVAAGNVAGEAVGAVIPKVKAGTGAAARAAKPAIAATARVASDIVDPEFTGIVSPRLAHVQRSLGRLADVLQKKPAEALAEPAPDATEANVSYAGEEPPAPEAPAPSTPAEILSKPGTPAELEQALNQALGGRPLQRGVSLRNQGQPPASAPALPEGFTPVESSALRGYKYDPATREFESVTTSGQHYIHGDVSPEDAEAFAAAESKGRAWQKIRENPLVAKVVDGERVSVKPGTMGSATGEIVPKSEAGMTPLDEKLSNLQDFMRSSPKEALAKPASTMVGTEEGAARDTALFQQAREELGPKATVSDVAKRAQELKTAPAGDLTDVLQQSLAQVQAGKGGVITSASPKALMERWGVDPESLAAGREQTRGMSAEETEASIQKLAAAYKKGQAVEPVMETRDAQNNLIDVDGRGRAIAAHRAGIKRIPVVVRRMQ